MANPRGLLLLLLAAATVLASDALPTRPAMGAALEPPAGGEVWVLLVAGSSGYMNYRHQADVCHAYQVVHEHGVPDSRIVTMLFDDAASSVFNPFKGRLFNEPGGRDVYAGVPKDYVGRSVTPKNFLAVLTGNKQGLRGKGSGRVIESGPLDRVFVYFADHGAPGFVAFPTKYYVVPTQLKAEALMKAFAKMRAEGRYAEMVVYVEACESGSMFNNVLRSDINVLAVSAATPFESSWACYYNNTLGTYQGDCFSNHWLENSDTATLEQESIAKQIEVVSSETENSTVCTYGDLAISQQTVSAFLGSKMPSPPTPPNPSPSTLVSASHKSPKKHGNHIEGSGASSRDVTLDVLRRLSEDDVGGVASAAGFVHFRREVAKHALQQEERAREAADMVFDKISKALHVQAASAQGGTSGGEWPPHPFPPKPENTCTGKAPTEKEWACYDRALLGVDKWCGGFTDYSLKYASRLLQACMAG
eukprot:CAMPEP_0173441526 /NCGR_PEP_ID=MMETSP1357-20121228/24003_1 /TAXON_ID=77926 /ORGANISM="Hemiselmis rufescens, Strain PCC563" /LENGTH=475 /DNA_ID=CAMNT_0014407113 /DNA_START=4 /DNA_END=1427 /DNA_ORIENTATION=-